MTIAEGLLAEFDHEMANTRKTLERCPDGKFAWQPHLKSFAMGALASHVANLPGWVVETINRDSLDFAPVGEAPYREEEAKNAQELLARFDEKVTAARAALAGASNENLMGNWTLLAGGHKIFTMPRIAVLRSFVMNHMIHHRAQLGVYLRLNDIPVPGIYGPSADEQ